MLVSKIKVRQIRHQKMSVNIKMIMVYQVTPWDNLPIKSELMPNVISVACSPWSGTHQNFFCSTLLSYSTTKTCWVAELLAVISRVLL